MSELQELLKAMAKKARADAIGEKEISEFSEKLKHLYEIQIGQTGSVKHQKNCCCDDCLGELDKQDAEG